MKFVEGGVNGSDEERGGICTNSVRAKRAAEQRGQDGVFGEMAAFAHDELNRGDGRVGDVGSKETEERADET